MSYPWLGYAPHPTADEFKAAEEKWTKELAPSVCLPFLPSPLLAMVHPTNWGNPRVGIMPENRNDHILRLARMPESCRAE